MIDRENSRWQLAFWLVTSICGIALMTLTSSVVANDRIRATEDQRIEAEILGVQTNLNDKLVNIALDVRDIKTRMISQNLTRRTYDATYNAG